jgi:hypothetical protein
MRIDRQTLVFFDASCLIAAAGSPSGGAGSPSGGAGFLVSVCASGFLRAAVSRPVLFEAERNVLAKLRPEVLQSNRRPALCRPPGTVSEAK